MAKKALYQNWLNIGDIEDRKQYVRANREVKMMVIAETNDMWQNIWPIR